MKQYQVFNNISNTAPSLTANATQGQSYVLTLVAKYGYILPKQITVTIDGIPSTNFTYTADPTTATLEIDKQYVKGDIEIHGQTTTEKYTVTATNNITVTHPQATHGEHFVTKVVGNKGTLPESITAKVNGRSLGSSYYFYSNQTGEFVVNKVDVVGNIEIGLCQ